MNLTDRDLGLLGALCRAVRLFAWEQLRTWWPTPAGRRPALRRLARLMRAGLIRRFRVHARPPLALWQPVLCWRPGEPRPDFRRAAAACRRRWGQAPRPTTVYVATRRCANLLGGVAGGKVRTPLQASHDLGVAAVYLRYLADRPAEAAAWTGEDYAGRAGRGQKKPDAVVLDPAAGVRRAVEFGAGYPPERLAAFHRHCGRHHLAYEVW